MSCPGRLTVLMVLLCTASPAWCATLTITPDQPRYRVGELIMLDILGDSEGGSAGAVFGRLLFDAGLASHVSSEQEPLRTGGAWSLVPLESGIGFADAFSQWISINYFTVDNLLRARVVLRAEATGTLYYGWDDALSFFEVSYPLGRGSAPGGSVTVVPEPATGALLALGLLVLAEGGPRAARRSARHGAPRRSRCAEGRGPKASPLSTAPGYCCCCSIA